VIGSDRPPEVGEVGTPPAHYESEGGIQPFDIIDQFGLNFYEGNAVKYIVRWRKKGGITDLLKARHYIEEAIIRAQQEDSQ
jgi:hypothetical protein